MFMYLNVFHYVCHLRKIVFEIEYEIIHSKNMPLITRPSSWSIHPLDNDSMVS